MRTKNRGSWRALTVMGLVGFLLTATITPAMAATALSSTGLTGTVSGSSVTFSTTIKSSATVTATLAGICVRSSSGANLDALSSNISITSTGTKITKTLNLGTGTYSYWSCAKVAGVWSNLDAKKPLTVGSVSNTTASASGQSMPVGNIGKFKQIFTDDFTTNLARGGFPGPYKSKWASYDGYADSWGAGTYNQDIISMQGGLMDMYLHRVNGRPQVAAPAPLLKGTWKGQTYGKYTIRFRADALDGYKAAWLLWPDSNIWNQGEIDFPEGGFDGKIWGFNHCVGSNPQKNCDYLNTNTTYTAWHTTSIEWTPAGVSFFIDGKKMLTSTSAIPKNSMHLVLMTETEGAQPNITKDGHVQIDWVSIYSYTP
jgi:hypothetical protein